MTLPQRRKKARSGIKDDPDLLRAYDGHRQYVGGFRCSVPGCTSTAKSEAAHVDYSLANDPANDIPASERSGEALKAAGRWLWPLCGGLEGHHAESHRKGARTFAAKYQLDPHKIAAELWRLSPHRIKYERRLVTLDV